MGRGGGEESRRDEPLWPKREVSGTAPRTAKDGVVKNVRIAAEVAGIVDGVLLGVGWFILTMSFSFLEMSL